MTPQNPETHLPDVLRDSKLPWKPRHPDQAKTPGPDDSWTADLHSLEFRLQVNIWEDEAPMYELRLVNTAVDREVSSWELPSLLEAAVSADSLLRTRLDSLLLQARRRLHDAA